MKIGDKLHCLETLNNLFGAPLFIKGQDYEILHITETGITLEHILYGNEFIEFDFDILSNFGVELKYGHKETYRHKMDENTLDKLTTIFNRSKIQMNFLFQLVDGDLEKLKELEIKIKNNHIHYCPGDKEEAQIILNMKLFTDERLTYIMKNFYGKV